jgi:hypothetical protein
MLAASTGLVLGLGSILAAGPASAAPAQTGGVRVADVVALEQEVPIGTEIDRCSGQLTVKDRFGNWVRINRGEWTTVDVAIDGGDYWHWRCGGSNERSRGGSRVKRLKIWHSTNSRKITWKTFDLLP